MWRFGNYGKHIVTFACLVLGNTLLAFLVAAFIMPFGIIMGGTTGIVIILGRIWPTLDVALVVFVLNMVLLLLGLVVLGKKFFLTTVASSVMYPAALALMERIDSIGSLTTDPVLAAIFAGCLLGLALGLVMRVGSSTGGMDVVALVLHHWFHLPIAVLVYITDFIVMGGQALFCEPQQILLGLLVLMLETITLDKTTVLGKAQMQLLVVSERYEQIHDALIWKAQVGVTMLHMETGFRRQEGLCLLCVIPPRKLYDVTELICSLDPAAFITISKINEVRGQGFTSGRVTLPAEEAGSAVPEKLATHDA